MTAVDLTSLLSELDEDVKTELASMPTVEDKGDALDVATLPIVARRWHKVGDAVAVVADLKNSTKLGTNKRAASTASIYEAGTGSIVQIFDEFEADFVAIQGDGAFALFWGDLRYERALCAGVTIKSFSLDMVERLEKKWDSLPETGFKVGVASSPLLAKRVGIPRDQDRQEPVWAGKAVNYAAKAAQGADRHELIVTGSVWDAIETNEYLTFSCPCEGPSASLWSDVTIDRLPDGDPESEGRLLTSSWCATHGEEFCGAVLAGEKKRDDVTHLRESLMMSQFRDALRWKAKMERDRRRNRRLRTAS